VADSNNIIVESNENNNSRTENFVWKGAMPLPPKGVTATAGPKSSQITARWNKSTESDLAYYRIYRGTSSKNYDIYYNGISKDWYEGAIIPNLVNGITYYIAITAVNTGGIESGYSNEVTATPRQMGDSEHPTVPANLIISDRGTGKELDLSWAVSTDNVAISHYLLYRCTNSSSVSENNYDPGFPVGTVSNSYSDYDLKEVNTYYYKVLAVDTSDNRSNLSSLVYGLPTDRVAPSSANNGLDEHAHPIRAIDAGFPWR
jgi:fibronectin type 3 domain-containing protein